MGQEKNFEDRIKEYLKSKGSWFVKYWGGGEFTKSGVPDILSCINGYFVGIEVKARYGKPSVLQLQNLKKIHLAGGYAVLLYPDEWELFKNFVDCLFLDKDNADANYTVLKERWWSQL